MTWKTIREFPNYEVNSKGEIRRCVPSPFHPAGRVIKPMPDRNGYLRVHLYRDGKMFRRGIHQIVATEFIGIRPDGMTVNHRNGIKSDNSPANLEYLSDFENKQHAKRLGLTAKGDKNAMRKYPDKVRRGASHHLSKTGHERQGDMNGRAKITDEQAAEIKQRLTAGESPTDIAKDYPITRELVYQIKHGRSWKHLP